MAYKAVGVSCVALTFKNHDICYLGMNWRDIRKTLERHSMNRMTRLHATMQPIIVRVRTMATARASEKKMLAYHARSLDEAHHSSQRLYVLRAVLFVLLYFSAWSAIAASIELIEPFVRVLSLFSGVVSSLVLLLALGYTQRLISIRLMEAQVAASYIVALDVKYSK